MCVCFIKSHFFPLCVAAAAAGGSYAVGKKKMIALLSLLESKDLTPVADGNFLN